MVEVLSYGLHIATDKAIQHGVRISLSEFQNLVELCLEAGSQCESDKRRYETVTKKLLPEVERLTSDQKERERLWCFAVDMIKVGRNYLLLI